MCLEHHLVGGYVRYISPHIIIIIILLFIMDAFIDILPDIFKEDFKGAVSSRSQQTSNRAWNRDPSFKLNTVTENYQGLFMQQHRLLWPYHVRYYFQSPS